MVVVTVLVAVVDDFAAPERTSNVPLGDST